MSCAGQGFVNQSRVRKPPGGESTFNIFGVDTNRQNKTDEVDAKKKTENVVQETKPETPAAEEIKTVHEENSVPSESTVESEKKGEEEEDEEKDAKSKEAEEEEKISEKDDCTKETSTSAGLPSQNDNNNHLQAQNTKNKQRVGYNPITGTPYGNEEQTTESPKNVGQTRVRQPPGGASTKLW